MPREGIQLCQPFEEKRLRKWNQGLVIVQPKLDGERVRAIITPTSDLLPNIQLLSSECNEILSMPHIADDLSNQFRNLTTQLELDGELYCHGMDFSSIHSRVSQKKHLHDNYKVIKFHCFDIINGETQLSRTTRLNELKHLFHGSLEIVPSYLIESELSAIEEHLRLFSSMGYEGIIVRHTLAYYERKRSLYVMKFKPRKSDIYQIIGTIEEVDKNGTPKNSLGAIVCFGSEQNGTTFKVGSGFTELQRRELWKVKETLPGNFIEVKYQALTEKKIPRFPIFSELIIHNYGPNRVEGAEDSTNA